MPDIVICHQRRINPSSPTISLMVQNVWPWRNSTMWSRPTNVSQDIWRIIPWCSINLRWLLLMNGPPVTRPILSILWHPSLQFIPVIQGQSGWGKWLKKVIYLMRHHQASDWVSCFLTVASYYMLFVFSCALSCLSGMMSSILMNCAIQFMIVIDLTNEDSSSNDKEL